jgi:SAM-dependent methyltransferase
LPLPDGLHKFQEQHVRPRPGRTLIVGSHVYVGKEDRRQRYADVLGVDMQSGPGVDRVLDLEEALPADLGAFAHVECMSVLEHSRRPWLLAANLERLLEPGGSIFVAVPFVWRVHGYPDDYWRFTASGVRELFPAIKWDAESYAHSDLSDGQHVPCVKLREMPYFMRCEVVMFGHK